MIRKYAYSLINDESGGLLPGIIRLCLLPLSFIYGFVIRALILFYLIRPRRLGCKVISVGNITLGGTGKTALAEFIAGYLKDRGHRPVIITRGYRRKGVPAEGATLDYRIMGDEAYMLSKKLKDIPVIVDKDRIRAAARAIRDYQADTVIFDDGFQQWRIVKDLDILTVDSANPFGNSRLIPRGILREPLSGLKRADIFVLTKVNINPKHKEEAKKILAAFNPSSLIVESRHQAVGVYAIDRPADMLSLDMVKGKRVALFSGIGDPLSFEILVGQLGADIPLSFKFSDHHHYTAADLGRIIKGAQDEGADMIITTEKDASRLQKARLPIEGTRILVLRIRMVFGKDEERFCDRLLKLYSV